MLLIFATFRCFALWDRLPRVALRLTLGCEPLAPLGRSFFQNALLRGKRVTISISEADLPGVVGRTPHRSLRSYNRPRWRIDAGR